jgi:hypothetical protein
MELDLQDLARRGLRAELARLDAERARIAGLLAQLDRPSSAPAEERESGSSGRKRQMSPEGRLRIQEAVRRRWERVRAEQASAGEQRSAEQSSGDAPSEATGTEAQPAERKARRPSKRASGRKK